jgi:hypothetical protein
MDTAWTVALIAFIAILALNCLWVGIQLWRDRRPKRKIYARIQGTLLFILVLGPVVAAVLASFVAEESESVRESVRLGPHAGKRIRQDKVPEIVKQDCQKLVEGQLLFEPSKTMQQGKPYPVFARLTRSAGVDITAGLQGSEFVIVKERVSCKVSMSLDSQEPGGFVIDKVPADRPNAQLLEPDTFTQWDWRVTPRKHGSLHLLLYVTPMLYVDGIGEGLKEFPQSPRIITVTPDYVYESTLFVKENWTIISGLLGAVIIPLFLWFRNEIITWCKKRFGRKKRVGFTVPSP